MQETILTPRLKLTLITRAERGTKEFDWLHELHTDEKARFWSLTGRSKSLEDTERINSSFLPDPNTTTNENNVNNTYRIAYAVHELLPPSPVTPSTSTSITTASTTTNTNPSSTNPPSRFIGLITLQPLTSTHLQLPTSFSLPPSSSYTLTSTSTTTPQTTSHNPTLELELAYTFLPSAWNKGYATESLQALFSTYSNSSSLSLLSHDHQTSSKPATPFPPKTKVSVRAIVNARNPASIKVMRKIGMRECGIYKWVAAEGSEGIFIGGEMRKHDDLWIFGRWLME